MSAGVFHRRFDRPLGRWFIFGYHVAHASYLILAATQSGITRTLMVILMDLVIPMTATTLALGAIRAFREHRFEMSDHGNKSGEDVE